MAKIIKIDLNLGQKIANPFKTTRKSSTNPFKYQDFEGNTIDVAAFADVFNGTSTNKSKLKLIASSVIGSITKLPTRLTESVVNFVNRVKDSITGAWTYAKNKNIEIAGLDGISDRLHSTGEYIYNILNYDIGKGISESLTGIGKNVSEGLSFLNKDVTEIGHDLSSKWNIVVNNTLNGKIGQEKISSEMPVEELRMRLIKALEEDTTIKMTPVKGVEARVA